MGLIPNAKQLPTGTVVIEETVKQNKPDYIVIYARVSSNSKDDKNINILENQAKRLYNFCIANG